MRDNGGIIINDVDFSKVKNLGTKWSFDVYGNPIFDAKDDELFKTYKVDDEIYFDIFTILIDQDDIILTIGYMFDVYEINKLKTHGSVANRMIYTSVNDCFDAAMIWIRENINILNQYFNENYILNLNICNNDNEYKIGNYFFTTNVYKLFDDSKILIKHTH